jgi:predicted Zn-dependent protease
MQTPSEVRRLLDRITTLVHATKGADALVAIRSSREGNTRFAINEISSSGDVDRMTIALTVQLGQRSATAQTNQQDDRSIDDLVASALRMARLSPENPEQMPLLGRQSYVPASHPADPATAKLTADGRAKAVGAALSAAEGSKVVIAGFMSHGSHSVALATTEGLSAYHTWTTATFSCTARTADASGSGWAGTGSNRMADLDPAALAKIAVDKATASARSTRLDPGRYTVILEPAAVANLLAFLTNGFDARRADEGRSFFSKKRPGDQLFPDTITLRTDPADPALTSTPFDAEGFPLAPTRWIDKGVLTGLPYNRFWAKKQGKPPTGRITGGGGGGGGNPVGWTLDGGTQSRDELIKGVQRGVLITRFWYLRSVDPASVLVTGLTRDGTFLIENGAITRPVNNFRFNESPVQMLARCDGLGTTAIPSGYEVGALRVPTLRTHEFNLASISEAV